jgi:hypothetical protein
LEKPLPPVAISEPNESAAPTIVFPPTVTSFLFSSFSAKEYQPEGQRKRAQI